MKKFLLGSLLALTTLTTAFCCWFTSENFNGNYIHGVNNFVSHYEETSNINSAVYKNWGPNGAAASQCVVDLPLTVWVKVSPRKTDNNNYAIITIAKLQYKIGSKKVNNNTITYSWSAWKTVKTIENVSWNLNFNNPVALFGRNNINPSNLKAGDLIMIRLYLATDEETIETGSLTADINQSNVEGNITGNENLGGGWRAPFVMLMKYSGKKRPVR